MATDLFLQPFRPAPMVEYANGRVGPSISLVRAFIRCVEQGDYIGAIAQYFHQDATVQENQSEPRRGREAMIAHHMDLASRYGRIPVRKVERFAINGNMVFINWVIELSSIGLGVRTLDEIAMQTWKGDRIQSERFYYDPAQLRPSA